MSILIVETFNAHRLTIGGMEEVLTFGLVEVKSDDVISICHILGKADVAFESKLARLNIAKASRIAAFDKACQWSAIELLDDQAHFAPHGLCSSAFDEHVERLLAWREGGEVVWGVVDLYFCNGQVALDPLDTFGHQFLILCLSGCRFQIVVYGFVGSTDEISHAIAKHHTLLAKTTNSRHVVTDKQNGSALALCHILHLADSLLLEVGIAYCQRHENRGLTLIAAPI